MYNFDCSNVQHFLLVIISQYLFFYHCFSFVTWAIFLLQMALKSKISAGI